ncbi:MAG: hydantoinase/oxoprolinase family protein [Alphaproteobacteria bacterium]|nr:hydantoinase/oxoprolinase family protein [Alphaproteobacteria bacterium]
MRVGIEVGGTFTDLIAIDRGRIRVAKVPSVPKRPDEGVYAALAAAGLSVDQVAELVHGSTVATNAVIERRGAKVAMVLTAGFRDLLLMQRQDRRQSYDLAYAKPAPIVPRRHCFEVAERVLADGTVAEGLDEAALLAGLAPQLKSGEFGAVAICLLNAYRNPVHEQRLIALLRPHLPGVALVASSDIAREFREYERASTTAIAAHVQPVIDAYVGRMVAWLAERQFRGRFALMQSNGGRTTAAGLRRNPVTALFSGPAAGVMGAVRQAGRAGFTNLITFDMGGTSTDVCLVENGQAELAGQTMVDGLPVRTPLFDIVSVGAGCGSLIEVDGGGALQVGPRSAGADPGPACYGRGGTAPTITDAHVVRGTIRPAAFLGGTMPIDATASTHAIGDLARRFAMDEPALAGRAIRIAEANVVRAIQVVSTERGRDPRDFTLVAFGGAGPLHAAHVAAELGIATVFVPAHAGLLSAYGLLAADYTYFDTETRRIRVDAAAPAAIRDAVGEMRARMSARLAELGFPGQAPALHLTLGMRFVGQSYEIGVDVAVDEVADLGFEDLHQRFIGTHQRIYRHVGGGRDTAEIVFLRLGARTAPDDTDGLADQERPADEPQSGAIFMGDQRVACTFLRRGHLEADKARPGPLIVEDLAATVIVPPGWTASRNACGDLILRRVPS